ncbi:tetratricopeptide repeat protein [Leptothrix sp. BB-4]
MRPWTALALSMLITLALPLGARAADPAPATPLLAQADALIAAGQHAQAVPLLQQLTDQGDRAARTRLARLYETGQGVPQDDGLAARHYERAAHMGDPDAQFALSRMFRDGRGVEADRLFASVWLRKAAANGHAEARALIGLPPLAPGASGPR